MQDTENVVIYPDKLSFWNLNPQKRINIVNSSDFRREKLLSSLGISRSALRHSFGITDWSEINKRQGMIRYLIENPRVAEVISGLGLYEVDIPQEAQRFINYFADNQNPFWDMLERLITAVDKTNNVPPDLYSFVSFLKKTRNELQNEEETMTWMVSDEMLKTTYLEGAVEYDFNFSSKSMDVTVQESTVYGFKKYGRKMTDPAESSKALEWLGEKKGKTFRQMEKILGYRYKRQVRYNNTGLLVDELPDCISQAIKYFIQENMVLDKPLGIERKGTLRVYFKYDEGDLKVQIINAEVHVNSEIEVGEINLNPHDFPGYSKSAIAAMEKKSKQLAELSRTNAAETIKSTLLDRMNKAMPDICIKPISVDRDHMEEVLEKLAWHSLRSLFAHPIIAPSYDKMVEYRKYFEEMVQILQSIVDVAMAFKRCSEKWGMPLYYPDILEPHQHQVMFNNLQPIHLIGEEHTVKEVIDGEEVESPYYLKAKDIVAINYLPPLNGNMFVFTGQNAGGKSAAEEAILNAIYLAQSGLPVFADEFSLNIKQIIGLLFSERGDGSKAELLLTKAKAILEVLEKAPNNGIVLILDEVGEGSQELAGYEYGKKLLQKLAQYKCSILLNTQITELAEYAQDDLEAKCFSFDLEHRISDGIGDGGLDKLMAKIGLSKMLEVN